MSTKVYVVIDSWGEYSDAGQAIAGVYSSRELAETKAANVSEREYSRYSPSSYEVSSDIEEHEVDE